MIKLFFKKKILDNVNKWISEWLDPTYDLGACNVRISGEKVVVDVEWNDGVTAVDFSALRMKASKNGFESVSKEELLDCAV